MRPEPRTERLNLRLRPQELAQVNRAAAQAGEFPAGWCRRAVLAALKQQPGSPERDRAGRD